MEALAKLSVAIKGGGREEGRRGHIPLKHGVAETIDPRSNYSCKRKEINNFQSQR